MPLEFSIDITSELEDGSTEVETVTAEILTHPSEITLRRWASYFERLEKMPEWFKDFHNAKDEKERTELQAEWNPEQWAKSYILFAKLTLTFVNNAKLEDLIEMPLGKGDQAEGTDNLLALFLLTVNTVYGYKPKKREFFEHKGRRFKAFVSKEIAGQEMPGADMTVRDAVNAFQLEHSWNNHTDGGANQYNINVGVLAALCREVVKGKVEKPPVDGPAYMQWSWDRQIFFEDVPMDVALDVVFFSTHLRALSPSIPLSLSCLMQASRAGLQEKH